MAEKEWKKRNCEQCDEHPYHVASSEEKFKIISERLDKLEKDRYGSVTWAVFWRIVVIACLVIGAIFSMQLAFLSTYVTKQEFREHKQEQDDRLRYELDKKQDVNRETHNRQ